MATHSHVPSLMVYNLLAGMGKKCYSIYILYIYIILYYIILYYIILYIIYYIYYTYMYIYIYIIFKVSMVDVGIVNGCFSGVSYHSGGVNPHLSVTPQCFFRFKCPLFTGAFLFLPFPPFLMASDGFSKQHCGEE